MRVATTSHAPQRTPAAFLRQIVVHSVHNFHTRCVIALLKAMNANRQSEGEWRSARYVSLNVGVHCYYVPVVVVENVNNERK